MGQKMTYRVALDDKTDTKDGAMFTTWMNAAGQSGIPTAFLVDKQGRIAWIGHPMGLKEEVIEQVLEGKFDIAKAKGDYRRQKEAEAEISRLSQQCNQQMQEKKWDEADATLTELSKVLPEDQQVTVSLTRLQILQGRGDADGAADLAEKISEKSKDSAAALNDLAWQLVTQENLKGKLLEAAHKIATKANEVSGGDDPRILATLARATFVKGDKDKAIELQQKALDLADNDDLKKQLRSVLDSCKGVELPKAAPSASAAAAPDTGEQNFAEVGEAVLRLLQGGNAAAFVKALAPSVADWRAAISTNRLAKGHDPFGGDFQKSLDGQRQELEACAKRVLAKAAELKLDFSRAQLTGKSKSQPQSGWTHSDVQAEDENLPWAQKLELVFTVEPPAGAKEADRLRGEYTLALRNLVRFPGGWRCTEGVQWVSFPPGVADEKTQCELTIAGRAAAYEGLTQAEDPALARLGEGLVRFVRTRNLKVFEDEMLLTSNADKEERIELLGAARRVMEQMDRFGIDFGDAAVQVREARFQSLFPRAGRGEPEGVEGNQLAVSFTVQSSRKSKTGASLSGDYAVSAAEAVRKDNRWRLTGKIQWVQFPPGVLDEKGTAELTFEKYVAEHGTLPPGSTAPDIEFVRLDNQQRMRLADLRGKVVILDFWSVACGPCQESLREMQKYHELHPSWSNRVEVVSLSVDNSLKAARDHLTNRGWTNTINVWAGPGGWESAPVKAFRVAGAGIPICYVIDALGVIVEAGFPGPYFLNAPQIVKGLLK
jgi:tetratricopeptide (TPR) repeat protein/thiol-disulfide isomerase/thioredoxin